MSQPLKSVALFHDLPAGGAKRVVASFIAGLRERGVEVDLFRLGPAPEAHPPADALATRTEVLPFPRVRLDRLSGAGLQELLNGPIDLVNSLLAASDMLRLDELMARLGARIDGGRHDVVFLHATTVTYAPALAAHLSTPSVYYCQEPPRRLYEPAWERIARRGQTLSSARRWAEAIALPGGALRDRLAKRLDNRYVQAVSRVFVNSSYSREAIFRAYGRFAEVVRLGVDPSRFRPGSGERDRRLVLSPGRVHPLKGHELALEAIALLPAKARPRLLLIGDSELRPFRRHLEARARANDVELEIRLAVSDAELLAAYQRAGAVVVLPVMEPLGLVSLEALGAEAPVVGVREGGVRETIVDGQTGVLVERDAPALAGAIATLLDAPQRARELGRAGRQAVLDRWTLTRSVDELVGALARARDAGREISR